MSNSTPTAPITSTGPSLNELLRAYWAGADAPRRAIIGLTPQDLRARPAAQPGLGLWTIQQVVVHLWHSDLAATHRLTRIAAEDKPLLIAYDESAFIEKLDYHAVDTADVCELFSRNRRHTYQLLAGLPEEAKERPGVHNHKGLVTLGQMLAMYVEHVEHHVRFIVAKRAAMGKPL